MAVGASRSEAHGGDGIQDSAWLEGVGRRWIVVRRPRETSEHQRHCGEPKWSLYGNRGWMYWYVAARALLRSVECQWMRHWRRSNETIGSGWPNRVRFAQYATSVKSRLGLDRGEHWPADWGQPGIGSGGQEGGQSGLNLRRARGHVSDRSGRGTAAAAADGAGAVGRGLHRRLALRRYGACCDLLGLLCGGRLQRMTTGDNNG